MPRVFGPVGLNIAAETPEEIALSVVSEIQLVLYGGKGMHLRWQEETNHPHTVEINGKNS